MPDTRLDKFAAEIKERSDLLRLKCKKAAVDLDNRLNEGLPALLGRACKVVCGSPTYTTREQFSRKVAGTDNIWAVYSFERGSQGHLVFRFPFEVGATLSGVLLVMADNRILEKVQAKELTEEDMDVLEEVANQLRGLLVHTFQKAVHREVHLAPEYIIRSNQWPEPFSSGLGCSLSVNIQIPPLLDAALEVVIDFDTLAKLFGVKISAADVLELQKSAGEQRQKDAQRVEGHVGTAVLITSDRKAAGALRKSVEAAGLRVARTPDFQELSNAVRSGLITAVIIDASGGIEKGLKLARVLRSYSPRCAIALGATSWSREHVLESLQAGVDALLTQPFETDTVAKKLRQALGKRKTTRATTPVHG